MKTITRIYGCENSVKPDMFMEFNITEQLSNGRWEYGINQVSVTCHNEPIEPIGSVDNITNSLKDFLIKLLNTDNGPVWIKNPNLHIRYNDETNSIFIKESELLG